MKQILITGGAGFVGFHLARYHIDRDDKVIVWAINTSFRSFLFG